MKPRTARSSREDGFFVQRLTDVLLDPAFMAEVADLYVAIFNAKGQGEWGESWTRASAIMKLFGQTADDADRCHLATWRVAGQLAGLCLTYANRTMESIRPADLPPEARSSAVLDVVLAKLMLACGEDVLVLQYRELGIRREHRGGIEPIAALILLSGYPANDAGAGPAVFWTSSKSRLYPIVIGLGLEPLHRFGDPDDNVLLVGPSGVMRSRLELAPRRLAATIGLRLAWRRIKNWFGRPAERSLQ